MPGGGPRDHAGPYYGARLDSFTGFGASTLADMLLIAIAGNTVAAQGPPSFLAAAIVFLAYAGILIIPLPFSMITTQHCNEEKRKPQRRIGVFQSLRLAPAMSFHLNISSFSEAHSRF
ncbi:hypothetical protein HPB50_026474 [Hyalomma asiaticum]|uniref:Uncharacterized protein n=1 Tax=Hyalomma asiaticum TaxID=266040 RepID=A0ACB7T2F1_HYAAI|nr:hypothetical protein HPB50_026474 [Hyalomma asiaticum]